MYESFYGFQRPPFLAVPDPDMLFMTPQHQRALALLEYAFMARAGFCVVTGEVGAGKTTLVRRLLQKVGSNVEVGLVSNTTCETFEEFIQWILLAFDLDYRGKTKVELYDAFVRYLVEQFRKGRPVTLIIDEAQHLGPKYLEQLRMLSNVNTEKGMVLQTILVGQPELWDVLRRPELKQFAQRISYDYFLGPLETPDLTGQYVRHRLAAAGGSPEVFEEDVYLRIWDASGGVPRLINLICDTALVYGYAEELKRIPLRIVNQVIKDKELSFAPLGTSVRTRDDAADTSNADTKATAAGPRMKRSTIERAVLSINKGTE
jgi:type II secretory pathway predicted ATPase ExeA